MPTQPSTTLHRHQDRDHSATTSIPPTEHTDGSQGRLSTSAASSSAELSSLKMKLHAALRQFPDFPSPGILFEDILPIFQNPELHESLLRALEIQINTTYGCHHTPDVIVGLEARGFLFGPSLALRMGAAFVPVRKHGKLPGPVRTAAYQKEYGEDFFQMQQDAIRPGQRVVIVDDIIATGTSAENCHRGRWVLTFVSYLGGSAAAAGSLVQQLGGSLLGYIFILELNFLKGREKLNAPVYTLLTGQEKSSK